MHDIIIVGAGPAGLTAGIYARRANKSVLVIDKGSFGGQITFSPKIENYPAFNEISGTELADKILEQALNLGVEVDIDTVTDVIANEDGTKTVVVFETVNKVVEKFAYYNKEATVVTKLSI